MPHCLTPLDIRVEKYPGKYQIISVPCGKCVNCCLRKGSEWSFRLMQEERQCTSAYFITLTYANEYVPITDKKWMGLKKSDLQCFFKRLRSASHYRQVTAPVSRNNSHCYSFASFAQCDQLRKPIKYYGVGEYGGRTYRPHYHVIIFNADLELIFKSWQLGDIHVGTVTTQSVGYCMKYMLKKGQIPMHKNDDRLKEFAVMSKGIGLGYLTPNNIDWHNANYDRMYVNVSGGVKAAMPRYYKQRIFTDEFREEAGIRQLARMQADRFEKRIDVDGSIWYDYKYPYLEYVKIPAALNSNVRKNYLSLQNSYL